MRAIIIPLSEILFNFEKHNGVTWMDRFIKKYPAYERFIKTKIGGLILIIFIACPGLIALMALYFMPRYLILIIRFGYYRAKKKMHRQLDELEKRFNLDDGRHLKNITKVIKQLQSDQIAFFVYYTSSMVPRLKWRQRKFFNKLESLNKQFKIDHIQLADTEEDIETMIWLFEIDRIELFLATMQIELSAPELVIPFKSKADRNNESGMIADKNEYQFSSVDSFYKDGKSPLAASGRGWIRMEPIHENIDDESEDDEPRFDFAFYMWLCREGYIQDRDDSL